MEEEYKYYVYALLDPRKSGNYKYGDYTFKYLPFYIGKGNRYRYRMHLTEASIYSKNICNCQKCKMIREIIEETGGDPIIKKIKTNLSEESSFQLETELIKLIGRDDLGLGPLLNRTDGGDGVSGKHFKQIKIPTVTVLDYNPTQNKPTYNTLRKSGVNQNKKGSVRNINGLVYVDFMYLDERVRESSGLDWNEQNEKYMREQLDKIIIAINTNSLNFADVFPTSKKKQYFHNKEQEYYKNGGRNQQSCIRI